MWTHRTSFARRSSHEKLSRFIRSAVFCKKKKYCNSEIKLLLGCTSTLNAQVAVSVYSLLSIADCVLER